MSADRDLVRRARHGNPALGARRTPRRPIRAGRRGLAAPPGVPGPTPVGTGQPPVGGGPTWPYLLVLVVPWGFWGAALVLARWSVCVLCVPAMR